MLIRSFAQMEQYLIDAKVQKRLVLAGSHDLDALSSAVTAKRKGVVSVCLIGDVAKTKQLLAEMNEPESGYRFIDEPVGAKAAQLACKMVADGEADIPMKGKMLTAEFMRAVLNKEFGFIPPGGVLSQTSVVEFAEENRLVAFGDCAVTITPSYQDKIKIIENIVALAHKLGMEKPRVAAIAPVEIVNPNIQSTVDAAMLAKANERGQITGCIVDGPMALDNAINPEAAKAKGVGGEVAGRADALLMPDLCAGNILSKSLHYFAHLNQSGSVTGARIPAVMTSRTDTSENKYYSILMAIVQSL